MHRGLRFAAALLGALCFFVVWDRHAIVDGAESYLIERGDALKAKGNLDGALADYDWAVRLFPQSSNGLRVRAELYLAKGDVDRAMADHNESVRRQPDSASARRVRGEMLFYTVGDLDRALADLDESIRLAPVSFPAHSLRGELFQAQGDLDRALADFNEALRLRPDSSTVHRYRGDVYFAKGDSDRAFADYTDAIKLRESGSAYYARGRAYFHVGAFAKAHADFQRANAISPRDAHFAIWLALSERRSKLPSTLSQAAKQLDMTTWPAPIVRLLLGDETPADVLAATADADPTMDRRRRCEAHVHIAQWLLLDDQKQDAISHLRLAAHECPPTMLDRLTATAELSALDAQP